MPFSQRIFGPTDCEVIGLPVLTRNGPRQGFRQFAYLLRRAHIDAIQDRRAQRPAVPVNRQAAGCDRAAADGADAVRSHARLIQQLAGQAAEILPPVFFGVMFGIARTRHRQLVRTGCRRQNPPRFVQQETFALIGADIDPEKAAVLQTITSAHVSALRFAIQTAITGAQLCSQRRAARWRVFLQ